MKLAEMTWQDVDALRRQTVVLIPTGSLEQHGPHLPLFTDSILATAVAEAVESKLKDKVLLTPTLWLGASAHHLKFPGTLTASFDAYIRSLTDVAESLIPHGFERFFVVNGHGGNSEPNGLAMRQLKAKYPHYWFGHSDYYTFAEEVAAGLLEGPAKSIQHACEAETSLMMHVRPNLVREGKIRDDGLKPDPEVKGMVSHFDEVTEQGSLGFASFSSKEKGRLIFEAAVAGVASNLEAIYDGYVFASP